MKQEPSYYAIIPANVRYADISANAKLLYGEITALTNKEGYCWASNKYFADLYKVSSRTVSDWVKQLKAGGFISCEITDRVHRKIFIKEGSNVPEVGRKPPTPTKKTSYQVGRKLPHNSTSNYYNKYNQYDFKINTPKEMRGETKIWAAPI